MKQLVHAFVIRILDYCNSILAGLTKGLISQLQRVQNSAARLVLASCLINARAFIEYVCGCVLFQYVTVREIHVR